MKETTSFFQKNGINYLIPFILITFCFALWGFANDITNPMVKAFSKIFRMNVTQGALVQVAFYGGYFAMAFPAALFIRKYSYKAGILLGLGLYAIGGLLFFPAKMVGEYYLFLIAYFILTCGLSFLETTANPFVLSMGSPETATRRLNLAQSFNPMGSLCGMFVAMFAIQSQLSPLSTDERSLLTEDQFDMVKDSDLSILIAPYLIIAIVIAVVFISVLLVKIPKEKAAGGDCSVKATLRRLWVNKRFKEGVMAQFFYVGAQIMCWTFIIQYATPIFMEQGMSEQDAEIKAQFFNIIAMVIFCCSRFICTFLLRYLNAGRLLTILGVGAIFFTAGTICIHGIAGVYCLVAISACMSLMFPTIYGIALDGLGDDAKLGAAFLIMSILGGSVLPPLQACIIDQGTLMGWPAVNLSFVLPLICFAVIVVYGHRSYLHKRRN